MEDRPPSIPRVTDGDRYREVYKESSVSDVSLTPTEDENKSDEEEEGELEDE